MSQDETRTLQTPAPKTKALNSDVKNADLLHMHSGERGSILAQVLVISGSVSLALAAFGIMHEQSLQSAKRFEALHAINTLKQFVRSSTRTMTSCSASVVRRPVTANAHEVDLSLNIPGVGLVAAGSNLQSLNLTVNRLTVRDARLLGTLADGSQLMMGKLAVQSTFAQNSGGTPGATSSLSSHSDNAPVAMNFHDINSIYLTVRNGNLEGCFSSQDVVNVVTTTCQSLGGQYQAGRCQLPLANANLSCGNNQYIERFRLRGEDIDSNCKRFPW